MSRVIMYLLTCFFTCSVLAQGTLPIKVKSTATQENLEHVLIHNVNTREYIYSKQYITSLKYQNEEDVIIAYLPGYEFFKSNLQSIVKSDTTVYLTPETKSRKPIVSEAVTEPNSNYVYQFKRENAYKTSYFGMDSSILSTYKHRKCRSCQLEAIKLYFDTSRFEEEEVFFVRLLFFDRKMRPLISSPNAIELTKGETEILFELSADNSIELDRNSVYYIGYDVIGNFKNMKDFGHRGVHIREDLAKIRRTPLHPWRTTIVNYSIGYKIYFNKK